MELILYILSVYGLSNIIVNENVFRKQVEWLKKQHKFLNSVLSCTTCLAFYIGIGLYLLMPMPITGIFGIDVLLAGIIASGAINIIEHFKIKFLD